MNISELKDRLKAMISADERWIESLRPMASEENTHDGHCYRKLIAETSFDLETIKAAHDALTLAQAEGFAGRANDGTLATQPAKTDSDSK